MGAFKSPVIIITGFMMITLALSASVKNNDTPKGNGLNMDKKESQMEFLKKYGYMGDRCPDEEMRRLSRSDQDQAFKRAIKMFQKFYDMEVTGEMNSETKELMKKSRCGNPDIVAAQQVHDLESNSTRSKRYRLLYGGPWPSNTVTYKVSKSIQYRDHSLEITTDDVDPILNRAFQVWAEVTLLTFHQVDEDQDIDIRFEIGDHGDGDPFDGPLNVLAHAASPYYGGDIHFDDAERWTQNTDLGINFFLVAVHEIGHALGLDHTNYEDAIMYASYQYTDEVEFQLHYDDVNGMQALYGKNTEADTSAPSTPSNTTSASTSSSRAASSSSITATTPTTTTPEVSADDGSNFCELSSIDAAYVHSSGLTVFFKGDYVGVVDNELLSGYPTLIQNEYPDLPSNLDAVLELPVLYIRNCYWRYGRFYCSRYYTVAESARTYFFKGDTYYMYQYGEFYGTGKIADEFPGIPTPIDAATTVDGTHLYFMKGADMWQMQRLDRQILSQPEISSFSGLPSTIDAAFVLRYGHNRFNYLFKDDQYYRITSGTSSVDSANPPYPRPFNTWWFGCPSSNMVALHESPNGQSDGEDIDSPGLSHSEPVPSVFVDQNGELIEDFEPASEEEVLQGMAENHASSNLRVLCPHIVIAITLLTVMLFT